MDEARPYLTPSFTCGGSKRNLAFAASRIAIAPNVDDESRIVLLDVQTSGGLLIAVPAERADALLADLREGGDVHAARIGEVLGPGGALSVD
jgi:selenide,water dikinase